MSDANTIRLLGLGDISIDEEGRVWRHGQRRSNTLTLYPEPRRIDYAGACGYRAVKLTNSDGKRYSTSAHRIQWIKAHGLIPDGLEVNHKDLNKANNRLDNLELVTRSQNIRHAHTNGHCVGIRGERHPSAKLTWPDVRFIREQVSSGKATQAEMVRRFGVSQVAITLLMSGKNWNPKNDPLNKV